MPLTLQFGVKRGQIGVYHEPHFKVLHFWLSCVIKSFLDTASFVGSSKTGIFFSIVVAAVSIWRLLNKHVKQYGWASLKTAKAWAVLLGEGALTAVGAFLLVWLGHLIAAPYGLYTEIEAQKRQAVRQYEGRIQGTTETLTNENKRLSGVIQTLQSSVSEAKIDCAAKEGISQTLQKQNRDQQALIAGCQSQALKLLTPEPLDHASGLCNYSLE